MEKQRINTRLHEGQIDVLKEIHGKKGVTISALICVAVDRFLIETEWIDEPFTPPIEISFLKYKREGG